MLHFINVSIDIVDPSPSYIPEDLSYNDQESVIEFIFEKVLGFTNAFEEYDDNDNGDYKISNYFVAQNKQILLDHQFCLVSEKKEFANYIALPSNGFVQIQFPPPKFSFV